VDESEIRVTNEILASNFPKWSDIRADIVANSGGEEALTQVRRRNQAYIDGYRLTERRKTLGLSQTEVADRMGVTKSRVSQIERGEVSTVEVIVRYVQALGGQIQISAVFGDDLYILRGTDTHAA
jgi:DNA-binding XRE family transcriptional regulator